MRFSSQRAVSSALFIIPTLTGGGSERVVTNLLKHLDRRRFRLTLVVVDMRQAEYRSDVPDDVEVVDLHCLRVRYALPKLIALIWRVRPDVVFSTLGHLNLALAILRPLLPDGVRYVARESSIVSEANKRASCPVCWAWAYRMFYSRFDRVVCQSQFMFDDLVDNFGVDPAKLTVIRNPLDMDRIDEFTKADLPASANYFSVRAEDAIVLVAAGRLVDVKGFDLLIRAVAICHALPLRVLILGEGPRLGQLEALACELGVGERIRFVGFQKNPYAFFACADAFVLSSRYEGLPNVLLEAMACGTPVIATPAPGGTGEILNGVAGCVLAVDVSAQGLAEAVQRWACGPRIRLNRSLVEPYRVERIAAAYAQILSPDEDCDESSSGQGPASRRAATHEGAS